MSRAKAGAIGGIAGVLADITMYGGEIIVSTLFFVFQDAGTILSFVAYLSTFASRVAWLPENTVEQFYEIILVLVLVALAYRLVRAWYNSVTS